MPYQVKGAVEGPDNPDICPESQLLLKELQDADVDAVGPPVLAPEHVWLVTGHPDPKNLPSDSSVGGLAHLTAQMGLKERESV